MLSNTSSPLAARIGGRLLATALVALSLIGGLLVLEAPPVASAEDPECEVTDLGTLGGETQRLEATGRWTTEDCESAFRAGSDAHSYSFEVTETGRVRIDLLSSEADSYLYLLSGAGDRIADNDDGAGGRNARIEQDLSPGAYRIEATTVGGRGRGPADFSLIIGYVEGCETVDLGVLTAEADLTAAGVWSLETCGSRIVETHPAYNYSFVLPASGRVRIDLTSEHGDAVLSLASPTGVIGANDDGGPGRNSRIEKYLAAGVYLIEATTYLQSDRQPLVADFELTVHLVDEVAAQQTFIVKMEETLVPDVVIAGEPFTVDFRAGNAGGGDLPEDWFVIPYAIGPRAYADLGEIPASETVWNAGASYHSSPELASATSTAIPSIEPIEVVLPRPGNSWIFVGVQPFQVIEDEGRYDNPSTHHGIWRTLRVLTGPTYGPVTVSVDGAAYTVEAADDEDGEVTTTVVSVADTEAEIEALAEAKATYTAAVAETVLAGIFERPGLEGLWAADEALEVDIKNASSTTLLDIFAEEYERLVAESDLGEPPARREAIDPVEVEDFVLMVGNKAARQYASLAASWSALQEQLAGGEALSFEEAFALQAELAYAERILAPVATGANIVRAAREAEAGWADRRVVRMARGLAFEGACGADADERLERFSALDAEIRAALPVFGYGVDAALCGALFVDGANARFLTRLAIESPGLTALNAPDVPEVEPVEPPPPPPYELRIIARLTEDGRVEHGVEFGSGFQILPTQRFLGTDARTGIWHITSEVEVGESSIGFVRARRLADGRIQLGFRDANGFNITPAIRFLPADLAVGSWLRSSVIEVPRPAAAE
ncbi:MAG: PPC domain-containing protein [Chloroflexi bacterium]|nr:PPC domain-containing protein [Chloroflexota bacterium]